MFAGSDFAGDAAIPPDARMRPARSAVDGQARSRAAADPRTLIEVFRRPTSAAMDLRSRSRRVPHGAIAPQDGSFYGWPINRSPRVNQSIDFFRELEVRGAKRHI
jgi:hypothetical protein